MNGGRRRGGLVLAGLWLLGAMACGDQATGLSEDSGPVLPKESVAPEGVSCARDSDCPPGSACSLSAGVCAMLAPMDQAFSVEVLPDASSGLVGDQFPHVTVSAGRSLHLTLSPPAVLSGRVFRATAGAISWTGNGEASGGRPGVPVSGRLVAVAEGRIPGTQMWSESLVNGDAAQGASLGTYRLTLLPGLPYRITFRPERSASPALPPHSFDITITGDTTMDIVLPPEDAYLSISGLVRAGTSSRKPLRNATVSCIVDGSPVGTTAVTGPDGTFSILVPPGSGPVDFRVAPGPDQVPFPERVFHWPEGIPRLQEDYLASGGLLILDLGELPPVRTVSIQVLGGSTGGEPVAGARVRAVGSSGGGSVMQSSVTGGDGLVTLALPEGRYRIGIFPPQGSLHASAYRDLDLRADWGAAFLVLLDRRPILRGQVLRASDGTPVSGAQMTLWTREDPALAETAPPREGTITVTTDVQGSFEMPLDPGRWAASLVPPSRSGLPRVAWPSLDLFESKDLRILVPDGLLVRGSVRQSGSQAPVPNALVRVMVPLTRAQSDATWSLAQTSFSVSLTTLAEVQTREDGTWDAIVPIRSEEERSAGAGTPDLGAETGDEGGAVETFGTPPPEAL